MSGCLAQSLRSDTVRRCPARTESRGPAPRHVPVARGVQDRPGPVAWTLLGELWRFAGFAASGRFFSVQFNHDGYGLVSIVVSTERGESR